MLDTQKVLYALSPVAFARDILEFDPDPWQEKVLTWKDPRLILNCCRQSGKSTTTAALAVHEAVFNENSLILLVSPSLRQSSELFRKVGHFLSMVDDVGLKEDNKLSLELGNGSRVVSLPSKEETIRGFSGANLIIEDEASRVDDDLYRAMRPMIAVSGGRIILMSTPFGKRGHFYEEWRRGVLWERVHITAKQCPRISDQFLQEELDSMGEWWFKQEYMGEFMESMDSVFTMEQIMSAMSEDVRPLVGAGAGYGSITSDISPLEF
ncbi:MAG: hypothetical protein GWN86_06855 [Desulfobacterales bacterium]|nr:hypothetical protein [Desulfobacterales bacterium]